ncbi:paramyosin-like [Ruditapes philippinarum]|uniref:paramyosin-like n=1 Tax=Ruditapes philippinarum TaxID=129788 RepID=UPI00295BA192|nr:paramyosin-like [Ruditapes philippinarum]
MASGGSEDSGFLKITGKNVSNNQKKKSKIQKVNKTTDKSSNENESLQQEIEQIFEMFYSHKIEIDDRQNLKEKTLKLLSLQSNVIERLGKEIQELSTRIKTLEEREQELKKQLIKAGKRGKDRSEYDQTEIGTLREQIDELKNTIAAKDEEIQKAKETKLNLSVGIEKLTKEMANMKDDITKKHEENMRDMKNDLTKKHEEDMTLMKNDITKNHEEAMTIMKNDITKKHEEDMDAMTREHAKQHEEQLEQGKRIESMLSEMAKEQSKKDQGQDQSISSQQNKPKSRSSMQNRPSKSGPKPTWSSNFKKSN